MYITTCTQLHVHKYMSTTTCTCTEGTYLNIIATNAVIIGGNIVNQAGIESKRYINKYIEKYRYITCVYSSL